MYVKSLHLTNFKNIAEAELSFSPKINCFLGDNGMGKSNLLDALYMLSFTRSFTGMNDAMVIRRGEEFAMARAVYERHGEPEEFTMGISRGRRKSFRRAGKEYKRLSRHIGVYPLVMAAPHDIDLVRGSAEERRRWMDMVISQSDARYLDALIRYGNGVEQRNRLLRDHVVDHTLYEAVELAMDGAARYIHRVRAEFTGRLSVMVNRYYHAIAGDNSESVTMQFAGSLAASADGSLIALLDLARRHDEIVGHTSVGPHRDDLEMTIDTLPMRRAASQGQCKTFTIALRLAQWEFLREATGLRPLLLLDDIFDKLDSGRVARIMALCADPSLGQIFITDTNRRHLDDIIAHTSGDYRLWSVGHGRFIPVETIAE